MEWIVLNKHKKDILSEVDLFEDLTNFLDDWRAPEGLPVGFEPQCFQGKTMV
jgi:hypothetical protein